MSDGDIYHGHLVADGRDNLLADEGDRKGEPVAYHDGSFIFLKPGEPSHNKRHHQQYAGVAATTEEDAHHNGVTEDDPHYDGLTFLPDKVAEKLTGHTEAYRG